MDSFKDINSFRLDKSLGDATAIIELQNRIDELTAAVDFLNKELEEAQLSNAKAHAKYNNLVWQKEEQQETLNRRAELLKGLLANRDGIISRSEAMRLLDISHQQITNLLAWMDKEVEVRRMNPLYARRLGMLRVDRRQMVILSRSVN